MSRHAAGYRHEVRSDTAAAMFYQYAFLDI